VLVLAPLLMSLPCLHLFFVGDDSQFGDKSEGPSLKKIRFCGDKADQQLQFSWPAQFPVFKCIKAF
jgi:hypothetical protein